MSNTNNLKLNGDTWIEYRRLVLAELERLDSAISKLAQANLDQEKDLAEYKTELIERLQKLKETIETHHRELISDIKKELVDQERSDVDDLRIQTKVLQELYNKVSAEVKIIKAKSALFGFLAGFVIALVSLIIKIIWNK